MLKTVRIRFSKTGRAKYISHLDLNRAMIRALRRAEIPLWYTEGFNRHPYVTFAAPLSLGYEGLRECMDFRLEEDMPMEELVSRLNAVMPEGIVVQKCYDAETPVKALTYVNYILSLEYENGAPFGAETAIRELLGREGLVVVKKSRKAKSGQVEVDIIPLIAKYTCEGRRDTIALDVVIRAQNPGLNPELIMKAIRTECPDAAPDFVTFHRKDVLDAGFRSWE